MELLICDNTAALGRLLAHRFINMGISSECCLDNLSVMREKLGSGRYKGVILFAYRPDEKLLSFISSARSSDIPVFAGLYTSLAGVRKAFRDAGAVHCFDMPCSVSRLCRTVMLRLEAPFDLLPQIELFLEESGFPRRLGGFCYLAKICELCINSPERLWSGMNGIYEETAEAYSTTAPAVERSLRIIGTRVSSSGALARLTEYRFTQKPTNIELICGVCDAFFRQPYK